MKDDAQELHFLSERALIVTNPNNMVGGLMGGLFAAKKKARQQREQNPLAHRQRVMQELERFERQMQMQHEADVDLMRMRRNAQLERWDREQMVRDMQAADRKRQGEIRKQPFIRPVNLAQYPLTPKEAFQENDIKSEDCEHIEI